QGDFALLVGPRAYRISSVTDRLPRPEAGRIPVAGRWARLGQLHDGDAGRPERSEDVCRVAFGCPIAFDLGIPKGFGDDGFDSFTHVVLQAVRWWRRRLRYQSIGSAVTTPRFRGRTGWACRAVVPLPAGT